MDRRGHPRLSASIHVDPGPFRPARSLRRTGPAEPLPVVVEAGDHHVRTVLDGDEARADPPLPVALRAARRACARPPAERYRRFFACATAGSPSSTWRRTPSGRGRVRAASTRATSPLSPDGAPTSAVASHLPQHAGAARRAAGPGSSSIPAGRPRRQEKSSRVSAVLRRSPCASPSSPRSGTSGEAVGDQLPPRRSRTLLAGLHPRLHGRRGELHSPATSTAPRILAGVLSTTSSSPRATCCRRSGRIARGCPGRW